MRSIARRLGVLLGAAALIITALAVPANAATHGAPDIWLVRTTSAGTTNLCISPATSGTGVLAVTCSGTGNDFWNIVQYTGYQTIVNVNSGKCLTATSSTPSTAVSLIACAGTAAQKWVVEDSNTDFDLSIVSVGFASRCIGSAYPVNSPVETFNCSPTYAWSIVY